MYVTRRKRAAPLALGMVPPAGLNWNWDKGNWSERDQIARYLPLPGQETTNKCQKNRPYDPNTLCTAVVNGKTLSVPCDLAPGPRTPSPAELDRWYQAALCDKYAMNSWAVANGEKSFEFYVAPDGQRYAKFYNGDTVQHADVPSNTLRIKRMAGDLFDIIGDIGNFLIKNLCTVGGIAVGVATANPAAGAAAGSVCRALMPGQAAPPPGVLVEGSLIQAPPDPRVYIIGGGTRHQIPDQETLQRKYAGALVHQIDQATMASIPVGAPIPSDAGIIPGVSNTLLAISAAGVGAILLLTR